MGIAAAVKGDGMHIVDEFSDCIRRSWNAAGLRKGYMYMVDTMTDPRWQRSYGTFGEDIDLICEIADRMIPIIQGSEEGVTNDGVALTMKHFPGGGARENGFDPHYAAGQWNVYQTPGSLEKYHLPGFQVAVDKNAASIMPYYAKPAKEKLGMFENPYRDAKVAVEVASTQSDWDKAMDAHRKSVTLLKNDNVLPLTADKLVDKKIYAEAFHKRAERAEYLTKELKELLKDVTLVDDPAQADYAILMLSPSSGEYFSATKGYLELDICEGKVVADVDDKCRPMESTHEETTLTGANRIPEIAEAVHANGGKVIANVNVVLAWLLGNVEPYVDALTLGYDTYPSATLDVYFGRFAPVGKLPITMPKNDDVLAVSKDGVCISPNDVPGYDKDLYMPDSMKDENGKAYAYRDAIGNYYEMNFGLSY